MLEVLLGLLLIAWEWAVSHWQFLVALALAVQALVLLSGILHAVNLLCAEAFETRREIELLRERLEVRVGDSLDRIEGELQHAEFRESLRDNKG